MPGTRPDVSIHSLFFRGGQAAATPEALDYIDRVTDAGGTMTGRQRSAIIEFVQCLMDKGLWSKMISIKPLMGGSAAAHALNLKDGTTTFDTIWNGGMTSDDQHNFYGSTSPGNVGDYGQEAVIPSVDQTLASATLFAVSRNNLAGIAQVYLGGSQSTTQTGRLAGTSVDGDIRGNFWDLAGDGDLQYSKPNGNSLGIHIVTRASGADMRLYVNGAQVNSNSGTAGTLQTIEYYSFALNNNGTPGAETATQMSIYGIGEGLTDGEALDLSQCIEDFLKTCGRYIHPDVEDYVATSGVTAGLVILAASKARESLTQDEWDGIRLFNILGFPSEAIGAFDVKDPSNTHTYNGSYTYTNGGVVLAGAGYINTGKNSTELKSGNGYFGMGVYIQAWTNESATQTLIGQNAFTETRNFITQNSSGGLQYAIGNVSITNNSSYNYPTGMVIGFADAISGLVVNETTISTAALPAALAVETFDNFVGARNLSNTPNNYCYNTISGYFITEDLTEAQIINVGKAMEIAQQYQLRSTEDPLIASHVQDFVRANNITAILEINALNQLYFDLRGLALGGEIPEPTVALGQINQANMPSVYATPNGSDLWDKIIAFWTISPTSSEAALADFKTIDGFNLTAGVSPDHSNLGFNFNGTNDYLRTGVDAENDLLDDDITLATYQQVNIQSGSSIGSVDANAKQNRLIPRNASDDAVLLLYGNTEGSSQISGANSNSSGLIIGTRRAINDVEIYRFTTSLGTATGSVAANPSGFDMYLGASNQGGSAVNLIDNTISLAFVASGLTALEIEDMTDAVQRYQNTVIPGGRAVWFDTAAEAETVAFMSASGINSEATGMAINQLVLDLKGTGSTPNSNDLWTDVFTGGALYPFAGVDAGQNTPNLVLPGTFDLTFTGGVHSKTGWRTNGTTDFADTDVKVDTDTTPDNVSMSVYLTDNVSISGFTMGTNNGTAEILRFTPRSSSNKYSSGIYDWTATTGILTFDNYNSSGLITINRTSNTNQNSYRFARKLGEKLDARSGTRNSLEIYIGAQQSTTGANQFYANEFRFSSIGLGMNQSQMEDFNDAMQRYQASMNRQIVQDLFENAETYDFVGKYNISSPTEKDALDALITELKVGTVNATDVWTGLQAIYPFAGGTAASHRGNLKDVAAFQLNFTGGVHSSNGWRTNGTSDWADTLWIAETHGTTNNVMLSTYLTDNHTESGVTMGSVVSSNTKSLVLYSRNTSGTNFWAYGNIAPNILSVPNYDGSGLVVASRRSGTDVEAYRFTRSLGSNATGGGSEPNFSMYLGARNVAGTASVFYPNEYRFVGIGLGMTTAQVEDYSAAVQKFQTTLGREVEELNFVNDETYNFVNKYEITDETERTAIDTLITNLKTGLVNASDTWSEMIALYPISPTSLAAAKGNLKDVSAFELSGGVAPNHSALGLEFTGTQYYDTGIIPSTHTLDNDVSAAVYLKDNVRDSGVHIGSSEVAKIFYLIPRTNSDTANFDIYNQVAGQGRITGTSFNSSGLQIGSRRSNIDGSVYRFSTELGNAVTSGESRPNKSLYFGARQLSSGGAGSFVINTISFGFIANGLTAAQVADVDEAIRVYQSALGREVVDPVFANPELNDFVAKHNITNTDEQGYLDTLITELKTGPVNATDVWSDLIALYPISRTSEAAARGNLKDITKDLLLGIAAIHSTQGLQFTGTQYYGTGIIPSTDTLLNDVTLGVYQKDNIASTGVPLGSSSTTAPVDEALRFWTRFTDDNLYYDCYDFGTGGRLGVVNLNSSGLVIATRRSATDIEGYRFATSLGSNATGGGIRPTHGLYLGASNVMGTAASFVTNTISFAFIGDGLTFAQIEDINDAIQNYQTSMGREVPSTDDDADAFIAAYSITDPTEQQALTDFVINLKIGLVNSLNLWDNVFVGGAIYPFVGGTAITNAGNLKDPGTFDLTFTGGTHSSTGWDNLGTEYADTSWIASTHSTVWDLTCSMYLTRAGTGTVGMGAENGASQLIQAWPRWDSDGNSYFRAYSGTAQVFGTRGSQAGLFTGTRRSQTDGQIYSGTSNVATNGNAASGSRPTIPLFLGCRNLSGVGGSFINNEFRLAAIGLGMTTSQVQDWDAAVTAFQTKLGRQV